MKFVLLLINIFVISSCISTYHVNIKEAESINEKLDAENIVLILEDKPTKIYTKNLHIGKDSSTYFEKKDLTLKKTIPTRMIKKIVEENPHAGFKYGGSLGLLAGIAIGLPVSSSLISEKKDDSFDFSSGVSKLGITVLCGYGGLLIGGSIGTLHSPGNTYIIENNLNQ